MDIMTEHHCNSCNLDFKNLACYKKHLKTSRHIERITNPDIIKISCICGKSYSYNQSLYVHQKKCERHQQNKLLSKSQKHAPLQVNRLKKDIEKLESSQKVKEPSQKENSQKETLQKETLQNEHLRKEITIMRKEIEEMKAKLEVLEAQSERMHQQLKFYARHELNRELAVLIAAREHNKKQDKQRKKISKGVRQKIAENQQNKCGECKQILTPFFHLDHIVGLQFGGTDEESNLMALCYECHTKKSMCENKCRKQIRDAIQTVLRENMIKLKN